MFVSIMCGLSKTSDAEDVLAVHWTVRLYLCLAVLPGFTIGCYLISAVSTGFSGGGNFFDVLCLCLYIDIQRLSMHMSLLLAPKWTMDSSVSSTHMPLSDGETTRIAILPGGVYVCGVLCVCCFLILARVEAGGTFPFTVSSAKVNVLASLNSYVFFAVAVTVITHQTWLRGDGWKRSVAWHVLMWLLAVGMLLVAIFFDSQGPTILGVCCMLSLVFYTVIVHAESLFGRVILLLSCAAAMFVVVLLSTLLARPLRVAMHSVMRGP